MNPDMNVGHEVMGEHAAWRPGKVAAAFMLGAATNKAVLGVFVGVALAVSRLARDAAGRTRQAARAAEADAIAEDGRMRTALLAAVSHDLRTPLAAAQAAVSCLRSADLPLTAKITTNCWPPPMSP